MLILPQAKILFFLKSSLQWYNIQHQCYFEYIGKQGSQAILKLIDCTMYMLHVDVYALFPPKKYKNKKYWTRCTHLKRGTYGVMGIVIGNGHTEIRVQILHEAVCFSHSTNTLGKGMHLTIFPSTKYR